MGAAILPPYGYSETPVVALDAGVVRKADAALIAAAVNALPQLVAALRAVEALATAAEQRAARSSERMFDGQPFPASVSTDALRTALAAVTEADR